MGSRPVEAAVTPNGKFLYVSNSALFDRVPGSISIINTTSNKVVSTVPVDYDPQRIAFLPNGSYAYVPNHTAGTVSVIKTSTRAVTASIAVGVNPVGIVITPEPVKCIRK